MSLKLPAGFDLSGVLDDDELAALLTPRLSPYCPHAPTEQQTLWLVSHRFLPPEQPSEAFYGGAAGGGKSDGLLMGALEYVDVPGYAALLLRRTFSDLALPGAIMDRSKQWLVGTDASWNEQLKRWTFPSGATIAFGYLENESDVYRYQSAEFQYVGFDELTQFSESQYTYLFSRLRRPSSGPLASVPLRMVAASNPGGIGHGWVKKRFPIDGQPRAGNRVFIPAKIADNPHLDRDLYRASLAHLAPTLQRQLEHGDWAVAEGLAFPEFRREVHVLEPFPVPASWFRFEFMDHGIGNPAAWYIAATDEVGNIVVFDGYYSEPGANIREHVAAILARRSAWWPPYTDADGRFVKPEPVTLADPSVRNRTGGTIRNFIGRGGEPSTIATEYREQSAGAINLLLANNDPKAGRARISELLIPEPGRAAPFYARHLANAPAAPKLYIVGSRCPELVDQLENAPLLRLDSGRKGAGEIVDPGWEGQHGHALAALRYGVMSKPEPSEQTFAALSEDELEAKQKSDLLKRYEERFEDGSWADRSFFGGGRYVDV
jgi:hypothetical protein